MSILWTLQKEEVDIFDPDTNVIWEFLKSFGSILFIIAVGILVLEIIRLLMDMKKEKFIRTEARYLFICLVGEATLLLLDVLISIYGAVSNIIGIGESSALDSIQDKIKNAIIGAMDRQLSMGRSYKRSFSGFKGRTTNKRRGGTYV